MSHSYLHITHFMGFAAENRMKENILHENVQVLCGNSVDSFSSPQMKAEEGW